jgi:hypothetical protein
MTEARTYEGGCHCGKVRYEVTTDLARVTECNCSICSKKGHLLTFVGADAFRLLSGGDSLADYQFNKMNVHHQFCTTCGIQSFAWGTARDGKKSYAVNVRCLDGVEVGDLTLTQFDGRKL